MKRLELNDPEADELRYILETYLSDLRFEISNTDSKDYRDGLKAREALVKDWLQRLDGKSGHYGQPGAT